MSNLYTFFSFNKFLNFFYRKYLSENAIELQLTFKKGHVPFEFPCFKKILKDETTKSMFYL